MIESNRTYVGVVEDNQDPDKIGRVKVRVMDVFDDIDLEDIPWAMPWKDLNGNEFNVPENGKIVMVVFDQGNVDTPEFIYADHYNINLENKLKSLSDEDYTSMKSLIFDHKTQIYVTNSEGLKIDHKYNNLNLTEGGIDLNLKDNNANLNIGDASASQQAILGNHFIDWLDSFLNILQSGGLFNSTGPTQPNPALIKSIVEFKSMKDIKFLSHHINLVDNNKVKTVSNTDREDESQYGDKWVSTKEENIVTEKKIEEFEPTPGPREEFNKPVDGVTNTENTVVSEPSQSPQSLPENLEDVVGIGIDQNTAISDETTNKVNPILDRMIRFLESKNYKVYKEKGILNIVSFRNKDNGVITNKFDEKLYLFYIDDNEDWEVRDYDITTVPGKICNEPCLKGIEILSLGQYIDQCVFNEPNGIGKDSYSKYGKGLIFNQCAVYINQSDDAYTYTGESIIYNRNKERLGRTELPIGIFNRSRTLLGSADSVGDYSFGEQIFKNSNQFKEFISLCEKQETIKNTFTYTLCRKEEFDDFN